MPGWPGGVRNVALHAGGLARPGGNVTGFGSIEPSILGKMLQTLKEIAPNVAQWPSAPGTAFMHNGNGLNMIYVDPENDLVAVVRWIDNNAVDGFLKRLIAAVAEKS